MFFLLPCHSFIHLLLLQLKHPLFVMFIFHLSRFKPLPISTLLVFCRGAPYSSVVQPGFSSLAALLGLAHCKPPPPRSVPAIACILPQARTAARSLEAHACFVRMAAGYRGRHGNLRSHVMYEEVASAVRERGVMNACVLIRLALDGCGRGMHAIAFTELLANFRPAVYGNYGMRAYK